MWFRNLIPYTLTEAWTLTAEQLHDELANKPFHHCAGLDTARIGWVPPLGTDSDRLTIASNGRIMLCLKREERILPSTVIREALDEKVEQIEAEEGRQLSRKDKSRLKDEIIVDLLPRAFTQSSLLYAYIDPKAGLVIVDSASTGKAEDLLSLLRETLGTLKVRQTTVLQSPGRILTSWLTDRPAEHFEIGDECELREPVEQGGIIRARRQDLGSDEMRIHLDAGKQVARLAVDWNERIACVLCDDLSIKRLRFLDLIMHEAADIDADDHAARFDADFALMGLELSRFLPALFDAFGGVPAIEDGNDE